MITRLDFARRRALAAAGSAAAIVLGSGLALQTASASAQTAGAQQAVSQNWSGYAVQSSTGQSYSSVSGSWVEPSVNSTGSDGYSAFWVGLGGASEQSQALEQIGTSAETVDGQTTHYAWYELVPSAQVKLPLTIQAGDHISAKVSVDGASVTVSISDQTSGQSTTKTLQMTNADTSSAEWIAEAPAAQLSDGSMRVLPLADFGNVTFTNASATAGGHTGPITDSAWNAEQIDMDNSSSSQFPGGDAGLTPAGIQDDSSQQSTAGASTGDASSDGTSFSVSYSTDASQSSGSTSDGATGAYGDPGYGDPGYGDPGYGDPGYGDPGYGGSGYGYDYGYTGGAYLQ
jgi:hypothetical protein